MAVDWQPLVLSFFLALVPCVSQAKDHDSPLGSVPAGWKYRQLLDVERSFQGLPMEVRGILESESAGESKTELYIAVLPTNQGGRKGIRDWKSWMVGTFAPGGVIQPHIFQIDQQTKVGKRLRWDFQELRVNRSGLPVNIAWLHRQEKNEELFLVLRDNSNRYATRLNQLKSLLNAIP